MESTTIVIISIAIIALLALSTPLLVQRTLTKPYAIAFWLAKEIEDTYGYRVISLGAPYTVTLNQTHITVKISGTEASIKINTKRKIIPSKAYGPQITIYGNKTHIWIASYP